MSNIEKLKKYIEDHGPIPAARVSSAQARGRAKAYPYWGVARYEIRLRKLDGMPFSKVLQGATSDRRSLRLADKDCNAVCLSEGRVRIEQIGLVPEHEAREILGSLEEMGQCSSTNA